MAFGDYVVNERVDRPSLNIGALLDIQTGRYVLGTHGEQIMDGGLQPFTGFVGFPNVFKTTILTYMIQCAISRYTPVETVFYDTENTYKQNRWVDLAKQFPSLAGYDWYDKNNFVLIDTVMMPGEEFIRSMDETILAKQKNKKLILNTPMLDVSTKGCKKAYRPTFYAVDSFSAFSTSTISDTLKKNTLGSSDNQTIYMKDGLMKSQLMLKIPDMANRSGNYLCMTAHIGEKIEMDPRRPSPKLLKFMRQGQKIKGVPDKFHYYTNNCWLIMGIDPLINDTTKGPQYPLSSNVIKGDNDLIEIKLLNLRGKGGSSGVPFTLVASQRNGIHPGLTYFHYLKQLNYGFNGNNINYELDLLPGVALSRTAIHSKVNASYELFRALEITAELNQIIQFGAGVDPKYYCTPEELYKGIVEQGYDWSILLNTRNWWKFEEDVKPDDLPFLSTYDLLKMRLGDYRPWWYDSITKTTNNETKKKK